MVTLTWVDKASVNVVLGAGISALLGIATGVDEAAPSIDTLVDVMADCASLVAMEGEISRVEFVAVIDVTSLTANGPDEVDVSTEDDISVDEGYAASANAAKVEVGFDEEGESSPGEVDCPWT